MYDEGVIKFSSKHHGQVLTMERYGELVRTLAGWRSILRDIDVIGQDKARYGGAGFGNLSARVSAPSLKRGFRAFLISGTQTGEKPNLVLKDYSVVSSYDAKSNSVHSHGSILPSSESLTHGALYDLSPRIRFVFHGHSPAIWRLRTKLRLPSTPDSVPYGTPDMARAVQALFSQSSLSETRVLAMGGHEDGIIAFGHTAEDAGLAFLAALARARTTLCLE